MMHIHKPWKMLVLIGVVLFAMISPCLPWKLKCNILGETLAFIQTLMAQSGSSVTNVTHLSTSNVPLLVLKKLKIAFAISALFVLFFVAESFEIMFKCVLLLYLICPFYCILISHFLVSFSFKMVKPAKFPKDNEEERGKKEGSSHKGKQLNQWPPGIYFVSAILI